VVWWLAKNDEHVEKTVADLALLAQLTSAANDTDIITQQKRYETAEDLRRRFDPPATFTPNNREEPNPGDDDGQ
jgi:hypothetical protein